MLAKLGLCLVGAALGVGAAAGVAACGEDRPGVEFEGDTATGRTGTGATGPTGTVPTSPTGTARTAPTGTTAR